MKRLAAAVTTLSIVLALPATATAKGPVEGLDVCGEQGCAAVPLDKQHGGPISMDAFLGSYDAPNMDDPPPGPFYELRAQMGGGTQTWFVVPGVDAVGADGVWHPIPADVAGRIADAVRGVQPYDFRVTAVYVDKRAVKDTGAFAPLFRLPPGPSWPRRPTSIPASGSRSTPPPRGRRPGDRCTPTTIPCSARRR